MRLVHLFALLVLLLGTAGFTLLTAQDGGSGGSGENTPLDLPSGGSSDSDEDEDAPESISFYGGQFEGDGFFWLLDRSCSMGWEGRMQQLKEEMNQALTSLSGNSEFGVVAFGSGTTIFSQIPLEGDSGNTNSANSWVQALQPDGATCMADAGVQCINISNMSDKENKQIIALSDGEPNCPGASETISAMSAANWQQTPINTIYISSDAGGISFMQALAAANNGTFSQPQ